MDPRAKAIGTMTVYGTVGGALLGTAALAFDAGPRSVARGASLGLYAGLLFGAYVVLSYAYRKHQRENPRPQENYYPGTGSPYEGAPDQTIHWNPKKEMRLEAQRDTSSSGPSLSTPNNRNLSFLFPVVNLSF